MVQKSHGHVKTPSKSPSSCRKWILVVVGLCLMEVLAMYVTWDPPFFEGHSHVKWVVNMPMIVSRLLHASHLSIIQKQKPVWLTNGTAVQLNITPLREIISQQFPPVKSGFDKLATEGSNSFYQIIHRKQKYNLCDSVEIRINTRNKLNVSKNSGGDYFFVHIKSPYLIASAGPEDGIEDHKNGTYTARFKLRWTGTVQISVKLMHSSEAITVLRRMRDYIPARNAFDGIFRKKDNSSTSSKISPCHISPYMFVKTWENGSGPGIVEFCNFTDPISGAPWFCAKPPAFPCSSYSDHKESFPRDNAWLNLVPQRYWKLLKQPVALKCAGNCTIQVADGVLRNLSSDCLQETLSRCTLGKQKVDRSSSGLSGYNRSSSGLSGYYYNRTWKSLQCKTMNYRKHDNDILRYLQNKTVYFLGDSTVRQWFSFLVEKIEKHKISYTVTNNLGYKIGLDKWINEANNMTMFYHHQGFPLQTESIPTSAVHYVANIIDSIPNNGSDTVFFICFGMHFTINTLEFYRTRLKSIKKALSRSHPHSPVIVKSLNTRLPTSWGKSNWYHEELNAVLLEEFDNLPNVAVIDVWNMTTGYPAYQGWLVHPGNDVLENELAVAFSYLCTKNETSDDETN